MPPDAPDRNVGRKVFFLELVYRDPFFGVFCVESFKTSKHKSTMNVCLGALLMTRFEI